MLEGVSGPLFVARGGAKHREFYGNLELLHHKESSWEHFGVSSTKTRRRVNFCKTNVFVYSFAGRFVAASKCAAMASKELS